jgi:thiopeptide-type bacteriocin biosynthesis protein
MNCPETLIAADAPHRPGEAAPGSAASGPSGFRHSGFFVLRAPLLPFETLTAAAGREGLRGLLARTEVREAVYVASPGLESQIDAWAREPDSEAGRRVEASLSRYAARMAGRATPFGLFAGCSVGTIGRATDLVVGGPCGRHTRLDMDYLVLLAEALARDPRLRPDLRFAPNSSLYPVAGRLRYREVRRKEKGWTHHRAVLEVPDYLDVVLARADEGATPGELVRGLLERFPEADEADAVAYVEELIENQVLVSNLTPALTGPEPIHGLIEHLGSLPRGAETAAHLVWVRDELAAFDAEGPGVSPQRYRTVVRRLSHLPAPVDESRLFQVDLTRPPGHAVLGENVLAEVLRGVDVLRRLAPAVEDPLKEFRDAFAARFGDSPVTRAVPLAEALDDETGVGFAGDRDTIEASSLLEGLDLATSPEPRVPWGPRESHLLTLLTHALARGAEQIALTDRDVERMSMPGRPPLPDAFAAMARLEADSGEAVARGDFRVLLTGASGPSGGRWLGRFGHSDPALADAVRRHLAEEETVRPDALFAEVVHLPEGRTGNILARPTSRAYEIPYLGRSGLPRDRHIPLDDLRVSVEGNRVVLRSARLGREVLPRLTSAHNFMACDGVYRFLCALQAQGVAGDVDWDWGPLAGSAFLPRVVYGRCVLVRARWRVTASEGAILAAGNDEQRAAAVATWRRERRIPRWVCLTDGDNELPLDLDDLPAVASALGRLAGAESVVLCEAFPAPDRLCAAGTEGRFVHEIVVPFVRCAAVAAPAPRAGSGPERSGHAGSREAVTPAFRRTCAPGSEWLSLKLYAGPLVIDHLVREGLGPLANDLVEEGLARLWFFVRYADPHHHLRVRFAGDPRVLRDAVVPRLEAAVAPLLADGRVWKVQWDTYDREVERYGGPAGIGLCEELFHHDSRAAVDLLRRASGDVRDDARWRLAFLGMDRLLGDLGLNLGERRDVLRLERDASREEFRMDAARSASVGARYRAEATALRALLRPEPGEGPRDVAVDAVLERRSRDSAATVAELRRLERHGGLASSVKSLAPSLLHMHANRMLRSAHRAQELVLYDFLYRHDEERWARRGAAREPAREPV